VEADPGDRVRRFDVTELSQALSVRLGALLGIAATMINYRLAAGFFCSGRGCSSCPRSEKPPSPTGAVWSGPLAYNVLCCTQMRRERRRLHRLSVPTAKAHMLLRASHRDQGGNQSTTAGSVSLRYDHALDAGLCLPRACDVRSAD
jgi:hypothetical protein